MKFLLIINAAVTAALAVAVYLDRQRIPVVESRQELVSLINANVVCLTESNGGAPNLGFTDWEYVEACLNDKGWLPWPQPPGYLHIVERMQKGIPTQVEMLQRVRAAEGQEPGGAGAVKRSLERLQDLIEANPELSNQRPGQRAR